MKIAFRQSFFFRLCLACPGVAPFGLTLGCTLSPFRALIYCGHNHKMQQRVLAISQ